MPLASHSHDSSQHGDVAERTVSGASAERWIADPYLHIGDDRIYSPLTDRTLVEGEVGYDGLRAIVSNRVGGNELDEPLRSSLIEQGWLVDGATNLDSRHHLKYVSLEAHTVCNQACYFCPVSLDPRKDHFMPTEQYEDIVRQLSAYRQTIEGVFMISYNEPTLDRRFVDQVRTIKEHGLPPAINTNGTGLTPGRTDKILEMGGVRYLSINMSTVDRQSYATDRGGDHLRQVLKNLDYLADKPFADEMCIAVLGTGDAKHEDNIAQIEQRYGNSQFEVKSFVVNDRAGYLQIGLKVDGPKQRLAGCDLQGSRPIQHLHITPHAKCILCCQDYDEVHVVGDLAINTVEEVLTGPGMQLMRRWVYGRDDSPDDFICRNCEFALLA